MNQKTAKLVRKYALRNHYHKRTAYKIWNKIPRNRRFGTRIGLYHNFQTAEPINQE